MKKVAKDSEKSFSQLSWNHAATEYERMKSLAQKKGTVLEQRAIQRMKELESKYPQLAK